MTDTWIHHRFAPQDDTERHKIEVKSNERGAYNDLGVRSSEFGVRSSDEGLWAKTPSEYRIANKK